MCDGKFSCVCNPEVILTSIDFWPNCKFPLSQANQLVFLLHIDLSVCLVSNKNLIVTDTCQGCLMVCIWRVAPYSVCLRTVDNC